MCHFVTSVLRGDVIERVLFGPRLDGGNGDWIHGRNPCSPRRVELRSASAGPWFAPRFSNVGGGGRDRTLAVSKGKTAVQSSHDGNVRFYVTDGPVATSVSEASESYFREGLDAGRGGVRVILRDGTTELISGSRYLEPGTQIRAEEVGGQLQILYLGVVLRQYSDWLDYSDQVQPQDYPLGRR